MRLSVETAGIVDPWVNDSGIWDTACGMIAAAGFTGIGLNLSGDLTHDRAARGVTESLFDRSDRDLYAFYRPCAAAAAAHQLALVQAHAPFPTYISGQPEANRYLREVLKKVVTVCGALGIPRLVVHPAKSSTDRPFVSAEEKWERNRALYGELIPVCRAAGVTVLLENMFVRQTAQHKLYADICNTPEEICRYVDALNDQAGFLCFGFCFDVGHSLITGNDPYAVVTGIGSRLMALHLHDNNGQDDQHRAPYNGIADWERFCQALKDSGYPGDLSFELDGALSRLPEALKPALLRYAAQTGDYFRHRITA